MTGRRRLMGLSWVLILTLLVLAAACQGTATSVPGGSPSHVPRLEILDAVTSRGVGGDYAPLDVTSQFSPTDTFYCALRVTDAEQDTEIVARWYFGDSQIGEATYTTEASGTGYVAFELTNQQPWPEGLYRVEILSAGVMLRAVEFRVAK